MLLNLHVKNLALIEEVDIEFADGLNILTGETGAGKSIIIGSINMALGQKVPKDIIRKGAEYAYIELIYCILDPRKQLLLKEQDVILTEDNLLIISRKIMPNRSISKINDETVTISKLRSITDLLIDIHGQHEHQSLLYKSRHLEILDAYIFPQIKKIKQEVKSLYTQYQQLTHKIQEFSMDQESRLREIDFCRFEIAEIEKADLKDGEEEQLAERYRYFANAQKIASALSAAYEAVSSSSITSALKEIGKVAEYDTALVSIKDQLFDADSILNDASREISSYIDAMTLDEEEFYKIETRLDLVRGLLAKYGGNIQTVYEQLELKRNKLEELEQYDLIREKTQKEFMKIKDKLEQRCQQLSKVRKQFAKELTQKISSKLKDLNFIDIKYTMEFSKLDHYTMAGFDEAEFMISTNPGEPLKPLGAVASGGELSRIMLAIKTVLAEVDQIDTLIFDEIDAGISGRTAQKVSEQMAQLCKTHQIICITHLPQIAAMADRHFEIAKTVQDNKTITMIQPLKKEQMVAELARLLGGAEITSAVMQNACEMKDLAERTKNDI